MLKKVGCSESAPNVASCLWRTANGASTVPRSAPRRSGSSGSCKEIRTTTKQLDGQQSMTKRRRGSRNHRRPHYRSGQGTVPERLPATRRYEGVRNPIRPCPQTQERRPARRPGGEGCGVSTKLIVAFRTRIEAQVPTVAEL